MRAKQIDILIIFVALIFYSCDQNIQKTRHDIKGYYLGDSISPDFKITEVLDSPFGRAKYISDNRLFVSTINNHIYFIGYSPLTSKEYNKMAKQISSALDYQPQHYIGENHSGIKIIGEEYYWLDSISGDEISIGFNPRRDSSYSIFITNSKITDSLSWLYVDDYDTIDYEFEIFEAEDY